MMVTRWHDNYLALFVVYLGCRLLCGAVRGHIRSKKSARVMLAAFLIGYSAIWQPKLSEETTHWLVPQYK